MRTHTIIVGLLWALIAPSTGVAESLQEAVAIAISQHERIKAAKYDMDAGDTRIKENLKASWFPQLQITGMYGREKTMNRAATANQDYYMRELDISVTQLLWDFGAANASLSAVELQKKQLEETLVLTQQALILEAVSAYYNFKRAINTLKLARRSENNIKRQAELENIRVIEGHGYSTDVLQAKTQLAGAQARRVLAEGALIQAKNRIRAVFKRAPRDIALLNTGKVKKKQLPKDVKEAVRFAIKMNPQIRAAQLLVATNEKLAENAKASGFFPTISGIFEHKSKDSVAGIKDHLSDQLLKVEASLPLNLGLSALETWKASRKDVAAAKERLKDTIIQIEEQVRNAWQNLNTTKENARLLHNQASIALRFLQLARKERKLGKRSLLDVLNGETAWINARSDAESAEFDTVIAAFTLLQTMGKLNLQSIPEAEKATKKFIPTKVIKKLSLKRITSKIAPPKKAIDTPKKGPGSTEETSKQASLEKTPKQPKVTPSSAEKASDHTKKQKKVLNDTKKELKKQKKVSESKKTAPNSTKTAPPDTPEGSAFKDDLQTISAGDFPAD
ncbi:TolC family protein [Magnetococcales bacterium HHB-1]